MFGLLTRTRRRTPPAPRTFRPCLEMLETRFSPSGIGPPPPSINLTMNFAYATQNNVTFSGQLTGAANDAGQTIGIAGYGGSTTVTTNANGNYTITVPDTQLGTVSVAYVSGGQTQATASVNVSPALPAITGFTASQESGGEWLFEGTVTGTPNPGGMVIQLGGLQALQGQTITVNANGTFAEEFQLNNQTGTVTASTTDWWGRMDNSQDFAG